LFCIISVNFRFFTVIGDIFYFSLVFSHPASIKYNRVPMGTRKKYQNKAFVSFLLLTIARHASSGRGSMEKPISERIVARIKRNKERSYSKNRSDFLVALPEIEEAIKNNWSVRVIWETLYEEGKIDFKYMTFLRHAKLFSRELRKRKVKKMAKDSEKMMRGKIKDSRNVSARHAKEATSSDFNPIPDPKELY